MIIETGCDVDEVSNEVKNAIGTSNSIPNGAIEILRLPQPGLQTPGKRVGDRVQGRVVVQYVGPVTIRFESDNIPAKKKKGKKALGPSVSDVFPGIKDIDYVEPVKGKKKTVKKRKKAKRSV
jgi:hypothetical protein